MECDNPEFGTEESQTDGLQLVRDINKYLRKALKKIEAIQKASDKLQAESSTATQYTATNPAENEETDSVPVKTAKKVKNSPVRSCKDSNVPGSNNRDSLNSRMRSKSVEKSNIIADEVSEESDVDANNESSLTHDTIEIDSEDEDEESSQPFVVQPITVTRRCIKFKLDKPTKSMPIPVFYKAFISNLPLIVNVAKLKAWLELKGVSNYEAIIVYTKQTFKTSVVSYYDKAARDRLLLLDGHMYDNWPLKIRIYVDQFTPDIDKEAVENLHKSSKQKR